MIWLFSWRTEPEQRFLGEVAEGDSLAATARPSGPADSVDIGLRHLGQIVVEDMGQLFDVQPPGGDVSGHQGLEFPGPEVGQGLLAGGLALVAVDGGGGDPVLAQLPGHLVGPVLGAGKDQGVFHRQLLDQLGQQPGLIALVHEVHRLPDSLHRGGDRVHRHPDRGAEERVDQIGDLRRHGGREEHGLLPGGQPLQDLLHVVDEAHVQHAVGLVQHEDLQLLQMDEPLVVEVHQPAGGGHQDVHPPVEGLHLGVLAHTAEDDSVAQGQMAAIGLEAVTDLDGQFPGGGEDQGADGAALHRGGTEPLKDGGGKGAGLACAGLGTAQHVTPFQGRGDGLLLNGGRPGVALFLQGGEDGGALAAAGPPGGRPPVPPGGRAGRR